MTTKSDGKFVFVKQYRKADDEALIEVIAGGLEAGEDPIEGAKRETAEDATSCCGGKGDLIQFSKARGIELTA